jgi:hypothetical protein
MENKEGQFVFTKIYLNKDHTKHCICMVLRTEKDLQKTYGSIDPASKRQYPKTADEGWESVGKSKNKKARAVCVMYYGSRHAANILFSRKHISPGTVAEEFTHAVLWSHRQGEAKAPWPYTIASTKKKF